jgi:putative effector of murein hydrolase LrgA (UPF0299 family)
MTKVRHIALAGGITWAAAMFLSTLAYVFTGYGEACLKVMASIYPGFTLTLPGSIVGAVYGFLDIYIGVYIFYWVYKKVGK